MNFNQSRLGREFAFSVGLLIMGHCFTANLESAPAPSAVSTNAPVTTTTALDTYRLVAQDKLHYKVEEDPAKSKEGLDLIVSALGDVNFPVTRDRDTTIPLNVKGKTVEEVRKELKARLDADYYVNATVTLQLVSQNQRVGKAQFFGEVKGPVSLPPGESKTVADGILELGYNDFAKLRSVIVTREDPKTKKIIKITVNVDAVLKKGDRSKDILLQDGDRVQVKEKSLFFN